MKKTEFISLITCMECIRCGESLRWEVENDTVSAYCCNVEYRVFKFQKNRIVLVITNIEENA